MANQGQLGSNKSQEGSYGELKYLGSPCFACPHIVPVLMDWLLQVWDLSQVLGWAYFWSLQTCAGDSKAVGYKKNDKVLFAAFQFQT